MLYIISFFRRLRLKTSFYIAFFIGICCYYLTRDLIVFFAVLGMGTLVINTIANFIIWKDLKKITNIKCKICKYGNSVKFYPARNKLFDDLNDLGEFACSSFDHGKYPDIYYCPNCKNAFQKNMGSDDIVKVIDICNKKYKDVVDTEYIKNLDARFITYKNFIKKFESYFSQKDVLEIGCYYGAFYNEVNRYVKSYVGIEPSEHACKYLEGKFQDIDVKNLTIDSYLNHLKEQSPLYDTIVLFDVIEHVPDPIKSLTQLNKLLRPGGNIIFSTINIESMFSIIMGPFWPWFMDMHYYYFSDRGYIDMLHQSGYNLKEHKHFPYYVSISYFLKKVMSIFFGVRGFKLLDFVSKVFIPIKLGDTVVIIGKKEVD